MSVFSPGSIDSQILRPLSVCDVSGVLSAMKSGASSYASSVSSLAAVMPMAVHLAPSTPVSLHHVDEESGDVSPIVGVVSDEL